MIIECKFCKYTWNCKSKHIFVTCPSCYHKTKVVPKPLEESQQKFVEAYKKEGERVKPAGIAEFGLEITEYIIKNYGGKNEAGES